MDRRIHLLTALLVAAGFWATSLPSATDAGACSLANQKLGICNDGHGITLEGSRSSGTTGRGGGGSAGSAPACIEPTQHPNAQLFTDPCNGGADGVGGLGGTPGAPGRVVTIQDVARFLPADAVLHEEPHGWAVTEVPANFWVAVQAVTVQAPLLGELAQVRFTPVSYRWSYGDGGTRTTTTPGEAWADLGQQQLTRTPTSHAYAARGDVQAEVGVIYRAEYRVGGGAFIPIDGTVEGDAPPLPVLVVNERTVLTNGTDGG